MKPILFSLWLFVLSAGLLAGGSIFEHVVLTPLWAGAPPESVMQWPHGAIQGKFFRVVSPIYALGSILLLLAAWRMPGREKILASLAGLSGIIVVGATFGFFIPILQKTQVNRGAGLTAEQISALVADFRTWNWARWIVLIAGWVAGLSVFASFPKLGDRRGG